MMQHYHTMRIVGEYRFVQIGSFTVKRKLCLMHAMCTHAIPCDPMRTLLEAVRECPVHRSGVVVGFQGNSSLQSLQKSWHRHGNSLRRPWCPACTIRQSQTISRIHMEFIRMCLWLILKDLDWYWKILIEIDQWWLINEYWWYLIVNWTNVGQF